MKRPTFSYGVVVALAIAVSAAALFSTFAPLLGAGTALRLIIAAMGLAYLLCLFRRGVESTGRITTVALWFAVSAITWVIAPPMAVYVLIHAGMLWLVRSLYFYSSALPALLDLGLSALSVSAASWAMTRSGSLFLAIWCFFLAQALFVAIPHRLGTPARGDADEIDNDAFERARRRADAALRQLFLH
jgi:hypothetical protein